MKNDALRTNFCPVSGRKNWNQPGTPTANSAIRKASAGEEFEREQSPGGKDASTHCTQGWPDWVVVSRMGPFGGEDLPLSQLASGLSCAGTCGSAGEFLIIGRVAGENLGLVAAA